MSKIQRVSPAISDPKEAQRKNAEAINSLADALQPKAVRLCEGTITAGLEYGVYVFDCSATAGQLDLPESAAYKGIRFVAIKSDATGNALTLDGFNSETINGSVTAATTTQYAGFQVVSTGTEWLVIP